jgi:hypothetical protein
MSDDTPDTLDALVHAAVIIREPGDLHDGRAGVVDHVQIGPWLGLWPVLVRFADGDTRWYKAAHVERRPPDSAP